MKVNKFSPYAFIFLILGLLALALPGNSQTLRGVVRNVDNGLPVSGARLTVQGQRVDEDLAEVRTDSAGQYVFGPLRPDYYLCRIEAKGFDRQMIAEINVVAGKERLLDIGLRRAAFQLPEIIIAADQPGRRPMQPLSEIPLTRDQTLRFPATFFDPARLAMAYPGVAQTDDGTNPMSIRGNSPATVRWRLEGVDVVNPNHLPNGGIFTDRPAAASGGVLMFSAQLLDNSALLTGAFPAGYGDAVSGVMDMHLRAGNDRQQEFTVQAGLIGLDVAAEGPLSKRERAPSYLVNYRYSTVGLLSQMGVSFGDEQINFQDLSFNLHFPTKKGGSWSVFGMGGLSENIFRHKTDSAEIKLDKDRYDIDFKSKTGILGTSANWRWGQNTTAKFALVSSVQSNDWSKKLAQPEFFSILDQRDEYRVSSSMQLQHTRGRFRLSEGLLLSLTYFDASIVHSDASLHTEVVGEHSDNLLWQPWINGAWTSGDGKWNVQAGVHTLIDLNWGEVAIDPRVSVTMRLSPRQTLSLAGGIYSQSLPLWLQNLGERFIHSPQVALGHTWRPIEKVKVHSEIFFQYQNPYPGSLGAGRVSLFNRPENILLVPFQYGSFSSEVRNYGFETGIEKTLQQGWFMLANLSLFDSRFRFQGGRWLNSRWNLGHLTNFTLGKEWTRDRDTEKVRTFGLNGRLVWTGGPRDARLDLDASAAAETTVFDESEGYTRQYADYFRIDLRAYWKRSLGDRRNSTFALDLQNVTMQKNVAYHYYDPFTEQVETKYQLGLIPNISWRLEF